MFHTYNWMTFLSTIRLIWVQQLWLDVPIHGNIYSQSDCIISTWYSYTLLKSVHDIGSRAKNVSKFLGPWSHPTGGRCRRRTDSSTRWSFASEDFWTTFRPIFSGFRSEPSGNLGHRCRPRSFRPPPTAASTLAALPRTRSPRQSQNRSWNK